MKRTLRDANPSMFRDYIVVFSEEWVLNITVVPKEELLLVRYGVLFFVVNAHSTETAELLGRWLRLSTSGPPYNRPSYLEYRRKLELWTQNPMNWNWIDDSVWFDVFKIPVFYADEEP